MTIQIEERGTCRGVIIQKGKACFVKLMGVKESMLEISEQDGDTTIEIIDKALPCQQPRRK